MLLQLTKVRRGSKEGKSLGWWGSSITGPKESPGGGQISGSPHPMIQEVLRAAFSQVSQGSHLYSFVPGGAEAIKNRFGGAPRL